MNYIDIIIFGVLVISTISGFSNGFVKELASLAALVFGVWGAIKFSSFTVQKLYDLFDISGIWIDIIAFIITFILIVVIIRIIGIIADKITKAVDFGAINRILGIVLGLAKAIIFLSVLFFILNAIDVKKPFLPKEKTEKSALYNPISDVVPTIFSIIDKGNFKENFDKFKKNNKGMFI